MVEYRKQRRYRVRASAIDFFEMVKGGTLRQVQEAIENGADLNIRDRGGSTPLMWASMFSVDSLVVTALIEAGADLEERDDYGFTPLMLAVEFNQNPMVIVALLKAGANPNVRDRAGRTAFEYAQVRSSLLGTQAYQELQRPGDRVINSRKMTMEGAS
jgi:ankyrin repeat protein